MSIPPPLHDDHALFLDFDGTLVDIALAPDAIVVDSALTSTLAALSQRLGGALALVSGRPLHELDHWLAPLRLPAAGVHGAERRGADGRMLLPSTVGLDEVAVRAQQLAHRHAGLRVERKGAAVALHYREAPQWAALCIEAMADAVAALPGLRLLHGKMVLEVLPLGISKGGAVEAFLAEAPFTGRRPLFVGDDVTDEDGFAAVQATGGIGIKVGPGPSQAECRLAAPPAVRRWLYEAVQRMSHRTSADDAHDA